jgi:hypothetical protein
MTFKYRLDVAVVDANDYRLGISAIVDCYNMQNVWIKGTKHLTNFVRYFTFVITLCWILMISEIKQIHGNYYSVIWLLVDAYFSNYKICYGLLD